MLLVASVSDAVAAKILVVGDSLSAAYGLAIADGWVALAEDRLTAAGCDAELVNAAISGETSAGGLSRLPRLLKLHQPSVVMIELGGNDGLRGFPPEDLQSNLASMIRLSREAGAKVLLLGIQIPTNYGRRYTEALAGVFPALAEELHVPLVPFFLDGIAQNAALMQSDGIHPNAEAQPLLAEAVLDDIASLLEGCTLSQSDDSDGTYTPSTD